jgi:acetyltransferase
MAPGSRIYEAFFNPTTVAIVGASSNPKKVGHKILCNLLAGHYQGEIVPVNPTAESISGTRCYKSLAAYGKKIDQSVIVIPRAQVLDAVKESIAAGAGVVTIITAGFKEQDSEGAELERQIRDICLQAGVRVLGPNCLGHLNRHTALNLSFGKKWPGQGSISFISQSGALCSAILDRAVERGFGLSKMISIGNKSDLSENEFINALADDPETGVLVCYLESITKGKEFVEIAEKASRKKPIIVYKAGVTASGSRAASSHTGSLAGADSAYNAAFKRSGIIRAHYYEQMFEYAIAFANQPLPKGRRVCVITNAGGPGIMTADAVELTDLTMATLEVQTMQHLAAALPHAASKKNPVDVLGDADPSRYASSLELVQKDANVDAIIIVLTPQAVTQCTEIAEVLCKTMDKSKPVLACFLGGEDVNPARALMLSRGLPDYRSPEKAVNALKAMCDYSEWLRAPASGQSEIQVDQSSVQSIINNYQESKRCQINEVDAKKILRAYGIRTAAGALVTTAEEAGRIGSKLGFPLVLKIVSPDIIHKSDVGGVVLNLKSKKHVIEAFDLMMQNIRKKVPDASITGAYLERMCPAVGREIIIGMTRDPQFGPMIMFGLGGILVEVLKDVTFALAPLSRNEALSMIRSIKTFPLLQGVRGQPGIDIDSLIDVLCRVSKLVIDFPVIKELDINPFMAAAELTHSMAADARITLSTPTV